MWNRIASKKTTGTAAHPRRYHPFTLFLGLVAVSPLVIFCFGFIAHHDVEQKPCLDIDFGMLELYTLHALRGAQLLGPYSRFGWNHPGPSYFYLLAIPHFLFGGHPAGLFLGAYLINVMVAGCVVLLVSRTDDGIGCARDFWSPCLLGLFVLSLGCRVLGSPWNPYVIVLSMVLFLLLASHLSLGRIGMLPGTVAVASFVAQTHIGTVPVCGVVLALSLGLCAYNRSRCGKGEKGRGRFGHWFWIGLSLFVAIAFWAGPLIEEIRSDTGNLTKIVSHLVGEKRVWNPVDAFVSVSAQISRLPLFIVRGLVGPLSDAAREYVAGFSAIILVFGLLIAFLLERRTGRSLTSSMIVVCIAALAAAYVSVAQIREHIWSHLVTWISAIGFVGWLALGRSAIGKLCFGPRQRPGTRSSRLSAALCLGFVALVALQGWGTFLECSRKPIPHSAQAAALSRSVLAHLKEHGVERPLIQFSRQTWPVESSVILQLYKSGLAFSVSEDWPLLLGKRYSPTGRESAQIVFRYGSRISDPRYTLIAEFDRISVYLVDIHAADAPARAPRARP